MFGIQTVWKNDEGALERYSPTSVQQEQWQETNKKKRKAREYSNKLDWTLKQVPWLFGVYLGSFSLILLAGLAVHTYKSDSKNVDTGNTTDAVPEP